MTETAVVIVGAGLSGAEIALELAPTCRVALCGRRPLEVYPNPVLGIDIHYFVWLPEMVPVRWARGRVPLKEPLTGEPIRRALATGAVEARPAITSIEADEVTFADGRRERYHRLVLATGYRPTIGWLGDLVRAEGELLVDVEDCGSTRHRGLFFVGYPFVRTFASRYIRGIRRDADWVAVRIARLLATPVHR